MPAGIVPERESEHHDEPVSFDPMLREYGWRNVAHDHVRVPNGDAIVRSTVGHDPMALFGGA